MVNEPLAPASASCAEPHKSTETLPCGMSAALPPLAADAEALEEDEADEEADEELAAEALGEVEGAGCSESTQGP